MSIRCTAVLRTDGSRSLGLGHLMRCLVLADGMRRIGASPIFVTRDYQTPVIERIRRDGFAVESFPASWDFEEDYEFTVAQIRHYEAPVVVTDLCNDYTLRQLPAYRTYLEGLKQRGTFLVAIDDLNTFSFPCDVVINPNYGAEDLSYEWSNGTRYLLGPKYFLFRKDFIELGSRPREIRQTANRVLVTMGGSDLLGFTEKVVRGLSGVQANPALELRVVPGMEQPSRQALSRLLSQFPGSYDVLFNPDNMAELMLWSDLAITAGGLTKYETAVTGTPSVVLSLVKHQAALMERFSRAGTALHLGMGSQVEESEIGRVVEALVSDYAHRLAMSRAGKRMVDGKGLERVLFELSSIQAAGREAQGE